MNIITIFKGLKIILTSGLYQKFLGSGIILITIIPNNPDFNPDFFKNLNITYYHFKTNIT